MDVRHGARSLGAVVLALAASGILATVALGDSCPVTVRWNGVLYTDAQARFAVLEPAGA
jgi:hypothetical protein